MSVMHCGDVGCPCRNLPPAVDDTAALRAEVARLRAVVGRVRDLCDRIESEPGRRMLTDGALSVALAVLTILDRTEEPA